MRLALLYHQFIVRGGLEGYLRELVRGFADAGHEIELVGGKVDGDFRSHAESVRELCSGDPGSLLNVRRFASESATLVPDLKADAVLGFGRTWRQDIHRAGGGCHAVYSRNLPFWKRWRPKNRWELETERRLYTGGGTRHFVVNAPMVAQEIRESYGVVPERISLIPTAVDSAFYTPAPGAEAKRQLRLQICETDENNRVLLFVSLDHRRKGLPTLLQALTSLPAKTVLWVVGRELSSDLQRQINRLRLTSRVRAFGQQKDLRPFYQAADLFVHPTRYDACANTVLQSMASGLPGIISQHDGAHAFVSNGKNGWVLHNPTSPIEIAGMVRDALASNLASVGAAARKSMLPRTLEAHVAQWIELITKIKTAP